MPCAGSVHKLTIVILERQDGDVGDVTDTQPAQDVGAADQFGGTQRRGAHDLGQRHAEVEELGHRPWQIPYGPARAKRMKVGGDRVGPEATRDGLLDDSVIEAAETVSHVEDDPAPARYLRCLN